jgi:orotate phosphoribosyltransferase
MTNDIKTLKRFYVEGVYETKALLIREQPFTLQSGRQSHIYLNHRNFLAKSDHLTLVANIYLQLIDQVLKDYKLAVVDSVMSPIIVGAMCTLSGKDLTIIKSAKLEHGTKEDIYGECTGEIVIIDDMTSTGGTIAEAAGKIRNAGGVVNYAVVSACRDQSAKQNLAKERITLLSIAGFDEILCALQFQLTAQEKELVKLEYKSGEALKL